MNYGELDIFLNKKVRALKEARNEAENVMADLSSERNRLGATRSKMIENVAKAYLEQLGTTPEAIKAALDSGKAPEGLEKAHESLSKVIRLIFEDKEKDRNFLEGMADPRVLEDKLEEAEDRVREYSKQIEPFREKDGIFVNGYEVMRMAEHFEIAWSKLGEKDFEKFRSAGALGRLFSSKQERAARERYENYLAVLENNPDIKNAVEGDPRNPLDVIKSASKVANDLHAMRTVQRNLQTSLNYRRDLITKREELEAGQSDHSIMHGIRRNVIQLLMNDPQSLRDIGNVIPSVPVRQEADGHVVRKPWDEEQAMMVCEKWQALGAMMTHQEKLIGQLNKALRPLERAKSKLAGKLSRIRFKQVRQFDLRTAERSIEACIQQAEGNNRWFRQNRDDLNSGTYGDFASNALMWSAVYLAFFNGEPYELDKVLLEPGAQEAAESLKETLASAVDPVSGVAMADVMSGLDNVGSSVNKMGDFMPGMDSVVRSMDSVSSSIDSTISSSSSFSSGGGFDGGGMGF